ncbi:P-loop containing nucleoside triphosphate hydrolase protein [Nemania abortiva]|nr:P-loop containing nucleoside triphosphate hydrolase protein [Nemania abortiva]
MADHIMERLQSLEDVVLQFQTNFAGPGDPNVQNLVQSLFVKCMEEMGHHLDSLGNSARTQEFTNEIKEQVDRITSHIEKGFKNIAQEVGGVVQNARKDHSHTQEEFEKEVRKLKRYNAQYLSVINSLEGATEKDGLETVAETDGSDSVYESAVDEIELTARQIEIRKVKADKGASSRDRSPPLSVSGKNASENSFSLSVSEDAQYWKRSAEQYEKTLKFQEELTEKRVAALKEENEEQTRSFARRHRALVEELADAKGAIRIMCRIKPESKPEEDLLMFTNPDDQPFLPWAKLRVTYQNQSRRTDSSDFDFQRVFGGGESNQDVFDEVKDFAKSAALGRSCTIMAYGATGTGKSYLFLAEDGLVLSYIRLLFQLAEEERSYSEYEFGLSAIEIYLDKVYDLLKAPVENQKAHIRLKAETSTKLESEQQAIAIIKQAIGRREAASTKKNPTSSRSHFIISIKITKRSLVNTREKPSQSVISLVDLAGSEAAGKNLLASSSSGQQTPQQTLQFQQGQDINQSLLDLGKGIRSLAAKEQFIPSHSLTRALQSSLDRGSRLLLVTTISPLVADQTTTLTTLRWSRGAIAPQGQRPTRPSSSSRKSATPSSSKRDSALLPPTTPTTASRIGSIIGLKKGPSNKR